MILPEFERSSGEIARRLFLRDARVPSPFDFDRPPRLLGTWDNSITCPDGRHLWDAIIAEGEASYDEQDTARVPFRLTLTCVRCGRLERLAGVSTDDAPGSYGGRVSPEPITAGQLAAQQVTQEGNLLVEWHVHDRDGRRVGFMVAGVTRRGRRFVQGRIGDDGEFVEGPDAAACLRKLARIAAPPVAPPDEDGRS